MKKYKVRTAEGLAEVPGKEVKIDGLDWDLIATRPLCPFPVENEKDSKWLIPINEKISASKRRWTMTEKTTGLNLLHVECKTIPALIETFNNRLSMEMVKSFPRLLKEMIQKHGIANE